MVEQTLLLTLMVHGQHNHGPSRSGSGSRGGIRVIMGCYFPKSLGTWREYRTLFLLSVPVSLVACNHGVTRLSFIKTRETHPNPLTPLIDHLEVSHVASYHHRTV